MTLTHCWDKCSNQADTQEDEESLRRANKLKWTGEFLWILWTILKDEKCLSPTGMGKQYQCKILPCRKAFNLGNYAYISVRRTGVTEVEGIRWASRSHHNCVQRGGTLHHHHHQNTLVGKARCQRGAGNLAGVMLVSVRAYPSDTSLTGRTALPYHWLPNGAQVHLIGRI